MVERDILAAAVAHATTCAAQRPPRESCGVVVTVGKKAQYWPCANIAEGANDFVVAPADLQAARAAGAVVMVVHSHIRTGPQPSLADVSGCEASKMPWLIVTPSGKWHYMEPCGVTVPLLGRPYVYGVHDCATLIRDWFALERGVTDIEIMPTQAGWWLRGDDFLTQHIAAQGFVQVPLDALRPGDVLLMQRVGNVAHHCALFRGDGTILHHLEDRLSRADVYGDHWQQRTRSAWRHACAR